MFSDPYATPTVPDLITDRLTLRSITPDDVSAVLAVVRRADWAEDFPSSGDVEIARLLARIGTPNGPPAAFGHRLIVERSSGLLVGGIGFFGPPEEGTVEIGFGVVPSRRGAGYATGAVTKMIEFAEEQSGVDRIIATAEPANTASIRVLEKAGMTFVSTSGPLLTYEMTAAR